MSEFQVGDIVVCVDAESCTIAGCHSPKYGSGLKTGRYYTISGIFSDVRWGDCVTLADLIAITVNGGFLARRFRKIDAPRTEIADRIRACKPHDQRVPA